MPEIRDSKYWRLGDLLDMVGHITIGHGPCIVMDAQFWQLCGLRDLILYISIICLLSYAKSGWSSTEK